VERNGVTAKGFHAEDAPMKWPGVVVLVFLMTAASRSGPVDAAVAMVRTVGVVDFYAPTPLGAFGFVPERYAADELSTLLAQSGVGQLMVVPRDSMEKTEASVGWHNTDVLHFDRLRALAQAAGANTLVVGWIPLLAVRVGGGGGGVPPNGSGPPMADTNLVLQVFDAAQGRLVGETRQSASVLVATTRDLLAKQVLHDALLRGVAPLARSLSVGAP
jgi:hypothetical protein